MQAKRACKIFTQNIFFAAVSFDSLSSAWSEHDDFNCQVFMWPATFLRRYKRFHQRTRHKHKHHHRKQPDLWFQEHFFTRLLKTAFGLWNKAKDRHVRCISKRRPSANGHRFYWLLSIPHGRGISYSNIKYWKALHGFLLSLSNRRLCLKRFPVRNAVTETLNWLIRRRRLSGSRRMLSFLSNRDKFSTFSFLLHSPHPIFPASLPSETVISIIIFSCTHNLSRFYWSSLIYWDIRRYPTKQNEDGYDWKRPQRADCSFQIRHHRTGDPWYR